MGLADGSGVSFLPARNVYVLRFQPTIRVVKIRVLEKLHSRARFTRQLPKRQLAELRRQPRLLSAACGIAHLAVTLTFSQRKVEYLRLNTLAFMHGFRATTLAIVALILLANVTCAILGTNKGSTRLPGSNQM